MTRIVLIGGFLGAGKTTLLSTIAKRLAAQGRRVGLITNDQAPDLVDSAFLRQQGLAVGEVSGSCFCCDFNRFIQATQTLEIENKVDIILAEPVGSCTDLSATIVQPLKDVFANEYTIAPLCVLVDPHRLDELFGNTRTGLHKSAAYILWKQLEEADMLVVNKIDLVPQEQRETLRNRLATHFPGRDVHCISALTGESIDAWLLAVLEGTGAGERVVEIDYDIYADGEAALGWLNASAQLDAVNYTDWPSSCRDFLIGIREELAQRKIETGHIKLLATTDGGRCLANLTQTSGEISVRRGIPSMTRHAELLVNARVQTDPDDLERMVRKFMDLAARKRGVQGRVLQMRSFRPTRPVPTHPYDRVITTPGD